MKSTFTFFLFAVSFFLFAGCTPEVKLRVIEVNPVSAKVEIQYKGLGDYTELTIATIDTYVRRHSIEHKCYSKKGCDTIDFSDLRPDRKIWMGCLFSAGGKDYESETIEFLTPALPEGAVDLGLSVKWASNNLGAESPFDSGHQFIWGQTTITDEYSYNPWGYYKCKKDSNVNSTYELPKSHDAAAVILGDGWRMPTEKEFKELCEKCEWESFGYYWLITGPNGNCIVLPCPEGIVNPLTGQSKGSSKYWSSTSAVPLDDFWKAMKLDFGNKGRASGLELYYSSHYRKACHNTSSFGRDTRCTIRPVKD